MPKSRASSEKQGWGRKDRGQRNKKAKAHKGTYKPQGKDLKVSGELVARKKRDRPESTWTFI